MRSWAYNRFGVLMGASWLASGLRWPSLRGDVVPMITLFPSQGYFCATALKPYERLEKLCQNRCKNQRAESDTARRVSALLERLSGILHRSCSPPHENRICKATSHPRL